MNRILRFSAIAALFLLAITADGQKAYKPIKAALKARQNAEVLKQVAKLESDSALRLDPRLYDFAVQANWGQALAENEKIYLKQPYDTTRFFLSIYGIYDYSLRCDTMEVKASQKGRFPKYQRPHRELLHRQYKNLVAGGRYFFLRKQDARAMQLLRMAVDVPSHPLFGGVAPPVSEQTMAENASLIVRTAYKTSDYPMALRYAAAALKDTSQTRKNLLEYLSFSALRIGDTARCVHYLYSGIDEFPKEPVFFQALNNYYIERSDYQQSLDVASRMLLTDSLNTMLLSAKNVALMKLGRYDEAVEVARHILEIDSTHSETYLNLGASLCHQAESVVMPENINSSGYSRAVSFRRSFYQAALSPLETYRRLQPADAAHWAPLLYKVYFSLNEGERFAEIEKILSQLPAEK